MHAVPLFANTAARSPTANLQYLTALKVLRMHIGSTRPLCGLHSYSTVGGTQALALAGRCVLYMTGRSRWKTTESVRFLKIRNDF